MSLSTILLKFGNKDIGLWLFGPVSSSDLKTGTILDNFNFVGYLPRLIEILNTSERTGAMMSIEHFSNFVGEEYKPCDFLLGRDNISVFIQSCVNGWKKKDGIGNMFLLTKSR